MGQRSRCRHHCLIAACAGAATFLAASAAHAQTPPLGGYDVKLLGLTGSGYEWHPAGALARNTTVAALNGAGQAAGSSDRFTSDGDFVGNDCWFFNGTTSQLINLTGAGYDSSVLGAIERAASITTVSSNGKVIGQSARFTATGANTLGIDSWLYNGSSTVLINPIGTGYQYTDVDGLRRASSPLAVDNSAHALGSSARFAADGSDLGQDAWFYNGSSTAVISPIGTGYNYSDAAGAHRYSDLVGFNDSLRASGNANRYTAAGADLGTDAWIYNGATTAIINLTGANYQYTSGGTYRQGFVDMMDTAGHVAGHSNRFSATGDDLGADCWFYNGTTTSMVGLVSGVYEFTDVGGQYRNGAISDMSSAGHVAGFSNRYAADGSDLGSDSWVYNGTSTTQVGLVGAGYEYAPAPGQTYRASNPSFVNASGHVAGASSRFALDGSDLGIDAWFYNGTSSQRINLTGGNYEYSIPAGSFRFGHAVLLKASGAVAGYSDRYGADGSDLGTDTWLFKGTTKLLNLTGGAYETPDHRRISTLTAVNEAGDALDTSTRFAADGSDVGVAGWFFDHITSLSTALEFSFDPDGQCLTTPQLLTENGVVLGSYEKFSGASDLGSFAFWWSRTAGFHELGALVAGGLGSKGWSNLAEIIDAEGTFPVLTPQYIAGPGLANGQTDGASAYLLTAQTPEPASLSIIALGLLALPRRRRA